MSQAQLGTARCPWRIDQGPRRVYENSHLSFATGPATSGGPCCAKVASGAETRVGVRVDVVTRAPGVIPGTSDRDQSPAGRRPSPAAVRTTVASPCEGTHRAVIGQSSAGPAASRRRSPPAEPRALPETADSVALEGGSNVRAAPCKNVPRTRCGRLVSCLLS